MGSTGDPPVPSGDPPDGMAKASFAIPDAGFVSMTSPISVGGSPTETGESPVPPNSETGSQSTALPVRGARAMFATMKLLRENGRQSAGAGHGWRATPRGRKRWPWRNPGAPLLHSLSALGRALERE